MAGNDKITVPTIAVGTDVGVQAVTRPDGTTVERQEIVQADPQRSSSDAFAQVRGNMLLVRPALGRAGFLAMIAKQRRVNKLFGRGGF